MPVAGLLFTLQLVVDELVDAGLSASLDPADLTPPCVWPSISTVDPLALDGNGELLVNLDMVVPDGTYPDVLAQLDQLMAAVQTAVGWSVADVLPITVVMPDSPAPLPALRAQVRRPYERE